MVVKLLELGRMLSSFLSLLASPSAVLISCLAVAPSYLSETTSGVVLDQVLEPGTGRFSLRSSYSKFIEPDTQSFGPP